LVSELGHNPAPEHVMKIVTIKVITVGIIVDDGLDGYRNLFFQGIPAALFSPEVFDDSHVYLVWNEFARPHVLLFSP
jgi:hypothetical protein